MPKPFRSIASFPVPWSNLLVDLLGRDIYFACYSQQKTKPHEWMGIVSSCGRRDDYACQHWQDSLHSALTLAHKQGWGIQIAQDTPYSQLIHHACRRYSIPTQTIRVRNASSASSDDEVEDILCLAAPAEFVKRSIPLHDRAVVFLSDCLFVLDLNPGGKIEKLLTERLACSDIPAGTTYLSLKANHPATSRRSKHLDWLELGAVGWLNCDSSVSQQNPAPPRISQFDWKTYQPTISLDLIQETSSRYLIHCTRSRRGPWPDQSLQQFHDEVVIHPWKSAPSALQTLQRILRQQRLIATDRFRRGNEASVCFSGRDIRELLSMRRFQNHLARWDWEPYGIMIDRQWLSMHGAKQVSYIDSAQARQLSRDQMTYFQVVNSDSGSTNWREEQEWRIAGDLRLGSIPFEKAIVFVPTKLEAIAIQKYSRWPIAITGT